MHLGHKDQEQGQAGDSAALQASVQHLGSLSLVAIAVELVAKAYTGQPGTDEDEPPWVDPFGRAPSAYEIANWLYLPRDEELDAASPNGRVLYGLISEGLQVLEHASLIRATLRFGYQGNLADAHTTYVLTRYGVAVRDAGAVERVLNGGTLAS